MAGHIPYGSPRALRHQGPLLRQGPSLSQGDAPAPKRTWRETVRAVRSVVLDMGSTRLGIPNNGLEMLTDRLTWTVVGGGRSHPRARRHVSPGQRWRGFMQIDTFGSIPGTAAGTPVDDGTDNDGGGRCADRRVHRDRRWCMHIVPLYAGLSCCCGIGHRLRIPMCARWRRRLIGGLVGAGLSYMLQTGAAMGSIPVIVAALGVDDRSCCSWSLPGACR